MSQPSYDFKPRINRVRFRHALLRFRQDRRISIRGLADKLELPFPTVGSWRRFAPSQMNCERVVRAYPGVLKYLGLRDPDSVQGQVDVTIRNRKVLGADRRLIRDRAQDAGETVSRLRYSLTRWAEDRFLWLRSKANRPCLPQHVRDQLKFGSGPISDIEDVLGALGIAVIRLKQGSAGGLATLVTASWVEPPKRIDIPLIFLIGDHASKDLLRYDLAQELGFLLTTTDSQAAARLMAVRGFADELLAPLDGLRVWLPPAGKQLSGAVIQATAARFCVPREVIERQGRKLGYSISTSVEPAPDGYLAMLTRGYG